MAKKKHNSANSQKSKKKKIVPNNGCFGNPYVRNMRKILPPIIPIVGAEEKSVHTFDHKEEIFAQMGRICNKVLENGGPTKIVFAPYTLYYDFHPQLVDALGGDNDKYIKCVTIYYYYLMEDIDKSDIPYYLGRFGIEEEEYNAMLAVSENYSCVA